MRRRADLIRWGNFIALPGGATHRVTDVKRITTEILGPAVQITLDNGEIIRRAVGTKLDVVRSR